MNIQEYLDKIQNVQNTLLDFLENDENAEQSFKDLCDILKKIIIYDKNELILFLHLISKISKNYHDGPYFISKIFQIIEYLEESIKKYCSNSKIFKIFKSNKRILLFLIEKKIIFFDQYMIMKIIQPKYLEAKYPQYFQPEIKPFMNAKWFPKYDSYSTMNKWVKELEEELPDDFYQKRKIGENDSYLCKLIRYDYVEDFIAYINRNNNPFNSVIKSSIFETNSFLIKKQIESDKSIDKHDTRNSTNHYKDNTLTLIKYAVFFGSIQIFQYLRFNGVELTPQLWQFSIHGKNAEIIHILEDSHIEFDKLNKFYFEEAIKCHHDEIANYFLMNYLPNNEKDTIDIFTQVYKYYNFSFLKNIIINENTHFNLMQYDYYNFAYSILNYTNIDANKIINESFKCNLELCISM